MLDFLGRVVVATALVAVVPLATAQWAAASTPAPTVKYEFSGNLIDSAGGSTLTPLNACPGSEPGGQCNATTAFSSDAAGTYWQWTSTAARGGGFEVETNSLLSNTYSIAIKFVFDTIPNSDYVKIIDYQGKLSDNGFYFYDRYIDFYAGGSHSGTTQYTGGAVLDLVITRDDATKLFTVYAKAAGGTLEQVFQYTDTSDDAIPKTQGAGNLLGFFFDDDSTADEATDGGRVYDLEMWSGTALTPAEVEEITTDSSSSSANSDQAPPPWLQSYGRSETGTCREGWHASWAEWPFEGTGGWVCNRTILWSDSRWVQNPNAVWGSANPNQNTAWDGS